MLIIIILEKNIGELGKCHPPSIKYPSFNIDY